MAASMIALRYQVSILIIVLRCTVASVILLPSPALSLTCTGVMRADTDTFSTILPRVDQDPVVEFDAQHKQLKVNARQQYLSNVLTAVSEATGIIFIDNADRGCDIVNIRFDSLSLSEAISKMLGDRSYVLREDGQKVLTVWLLPIGSQDRLTDTDIINEEFYDSLRGSILTEELAEQLKKFEQ
jgi:hypothetical protein